jgi:hypothetical protein
MNILRLSAVCLLPLLAGCVVVKDNVLYATGRVKYPGYRVEYVDAQPAPGTLLRAGEAVLFNVKVRYALQSAAQGSIVMYFRTRRGLPLLEGQEIWTKVEQGSGEASLATEVVVPDSAHEMWVWVPLIPEGLKDRPEGFLQIRYPVARP